MDMDIIMVVVVGAGVAVVAMVVETMVAVVTMVVDSTVITTLETVVAITMAWYTSHTQYQSHRMSRLAILVCSAALWIPHHLPLMIYPMGQRYKPALDANQTRLI